MKLLFTPLDVQRVTGLSYRQLQYWDRSGFISPSVRTGGNYRRYTFDDLVLLELIKRLRDHRFSVQKLREVFGKIRGLLPHVDADEGQLTLFMEGDRVMIFTGTTILDSHLDRATIRFAVSELRTKLATLFGEAQAGARRQSAAS